PVLTDTTGKSKVYPIHVPTNTAPESKVTYSWVELGPQERTQLGLNNAAKGEENPRKKRVWDIAQLNMDKAFQIKLQGREGEEVDQLEGALFYARQVKDRTMPEAEKRKKQFEYFVLARNPEIDPKTGKEKPRIDGSLLQRARVYTGEGRPVV